MKTMEFKAATSYLQCPNCKKEYDASVPQSYATCCSQPLVTVFEKEIKSKSVINQDEDSMWRYKAVLPVSKATRLISLKEGWTKMHKLDKLAAESGCRSMLLKDESTNPTGSFKARGISMAVTKALELGIDHCIMPTAGNAGGALAAYCAKADMKATIIMPRHTPGTLQEECRIHGAELILLDGLIDKCGKMAKSMAAEKGYFDMSTLKEPYRLEGKKTIGYEIAEQLNWTLPDVIVYPTGGGTGLIGMWKAFKEMKAMGWIMGKLPRMVIVQTEGCAPMLQVFEYGRISEDFDPQPSSAYGLAVPYPFAADMMLQVLNQSRGTVITVSEKEIEEGTNKVARAEGILLSPEGSATYVAAQKLMQNTWINQHDKVLLFNTGSWMKYRP